jgi:hypothetical protein
LLKTSGGRRHGELELEFGSVPVFPWNLLEQGTEWTQATKTELLKLLSGVCKLAGISSDNQLTDEAKAVFLVVIGCRKKGGFQRPVLARS